MEQKQKAVPERTAPNDTAKIRIYPLAELNQRIFNLANRFVVDFVDVL